MAVWSPLLQAGSEGPTFIFCTACACCAFLTQANLVHHVSDQKVGNILRRHGIAPDQASRRGVRERADENRIHELKRQLAELRRGGFEVRSIEHKTAIPGWRQACAHVHYSDSYGNEFVLTVR